MVQEMELWFKRWNFGSKDGTLVQKMELWFKRWNFGSKDGTLVQKMELWFSEDGTWFSEDGTWFSLAKMELAWRIELGLEDESSFRRWKLVQKMELGSEDGRWNLLEKIELGSEDGLCFRRWKLFEKMELASEDGICFKRWSLLHKIELGSKNGVYFKRWNLVQKIELPSEDREMEGVLFFKESKNIRTHGSPTGFVWTESPPSAACCSRWGKTLNENPQFLKSQLDMRRTTFTFDLAHAPYLKNANFLIRIWFCSARNNAISMRGVDCQGLKKL